MAGETKAASNHSTKEKMEKNLVFDIGLHRGEDSEFYLKKGFNVIGVEANSALCEEVSHRFQEEIHSGQFKVINKAVAHQSGLMTFYINSKDSIWSTLNPEWADRNGRNGSYSSESEVEATTLVALIKEFGTPYYMKIDIEGSDLLAVEGLAHLTDRPKYLSIESEKDSFRGLRREISIMSSLGYNQFNIVNQPNVVRQRPPNPPKEGRYARHQFDFGSSGLFGEELPGPWITADEAIEAYRPIFLRYGLCGDDPFLRSRLVRVLLRRIGFRAEWYDTHARRK
jgi:FkbM family methyltransferase